MKVNGDFVPVPDGSYKLEDREVLRFINSEDKRKRRKLIYNVILHILAIIGAILFFTSCSDSERDKQRAEQKKITQAIEKRIDSLQRIQ